MKLAVLLAFVVPFAWLVGCGGMVVVDRDGGGRGGDGGSGAGGTVGGGSQGGSGSCSGTDCEGNSLDCSCKTTCPGQVLRAECKMNDSSTVICECHLDNKYLGTCGEVSSSACTLPNGCCTEYL